MIENGIKMVAMSVQWLNQLQCIAYQSADAIWIREFGGQTSEFLSRKG
jgi:hypothetical protein